MTSITTAALVARQSRSDDGSMSIPDQIDAMREYCATNGIEVGNVYTESDVSGRKPLDKRRGLKLAVEDVERGDAQMILTAYFDRFVRSVSTRAEVLLRVEKKKGVIYTLDMGQTSNATPVSKFTGTVLAAAAELMAEQSGEKTQVAKQRNIDAGIPPFPRITPAYQRRPDGRLEPHKTNAPLVRRAVEMRLANPPLSWDKIAVWLNEQGIEVYSIKGERKPITGLGVRKMLESRLMVGEIHFGDFTPNLDAIDEPIMSHATYHRLHKTRAPRGRYGKSERLLARLGVLRCSTCEGRMSVNSTESKGTRYYYYVCGAPLCPKRISIAVQVAENTVRDETIRLGRKLRGRASDADAVKAARLEWVEAETALDNAIRTLAGLGGRMATKDVLSELEADRDAKATKHERLLASSGAGVVTSLADWDRALFAEQQRFIKAVIASAVVAPGRGPDRITVTPRSGFVE